MKHLRLTSAHYTHLEADYMHWLDLLGYAPSTVYNLGNHVREFFYRLEAQNIPLSQLTALHFSSHYHYLKSRSNHRWGGGLSINALNKHIQALHKLAEYLGKQGYGLSELNLQRSASDQLLPTVLTIAQIESLYQATEGYHLGTPLEALNQRDRAMLTLLYSCALRRNEAYHLDLTDIDLDKQVLLVRKGKNYRQRYVPFSKKAGRYLEDYLYEARPSLRKSRPQEAFLLNYRGDRMGGQSFSNRLKILQLRSDCILLQQKALHPHLLRHSIATHLLQNGMELEQIARFLGHNSLESTQRYTHLITRSHTDLAHQDDQPTMNPCA